MLKAVENDYPQCPKLLKPEVLISNATTQLLNRTLLLTIAKIRTDFCKQNQYYNFSLALPLINCIFWEMSASYGVRLQLQSALVLGRYLNKIIEKEAHKDKIFDKSYIFSQLTRRKFDKKVFSLVRENIQIEQIDPDILRTLTLDRSCQKKYNPVITLENLKN